MEPTTGEALVNRFRSEYPQFSKLRASASGTTLKIKSSDGKVTLRLFARDEDWTVETDEAHTHVDSLDEAFEVAAKLIVGEARAANEFRGDQLAGQWFEIRDGEHFESGHRALYINPYDPAEWQSWPGEHWRQKRVTYSFNPMSGVITRSAMERDCKSSEIRPGSVDWLTDGLGQPQAGLTWTSSQEQTYVFQKPEGWRMSPDAHGLLFKSYGGTMAVRASSLLAAPTAVETVPATAIRPCAIERFSKDSKRSWNSRQWQLYFLDKGVIAPIEMLFMPEVKTEAEAIFLMLDSAMPLALLTPDEWDFRYDGDS